MVAVREPILTPVEITDLRPTQITVGMREVKAKQKRWREMKDEKGSKFLGTHMIPVILAPRSGTTSSTTITSRARFTKKASRR